jgi:hypothetical protein
VAGCGTATQTVEVGWTVDRVINGTDTTPHLFIFATNNGYATGCYNNIDTGDGCLTWVPNTGASLAPNSALPASNIAEGFPVDNQLTISIGHIRSCRSLSCPWLGWAVWAGVNTSGPLIYLGYYAQADYMNGGLATGNTGFEIGAEVRDQTATWLSPPHVQMGFFPLAFGPNYIGYAHKYYYYDVNGTEQSGGAFFPKAVQGTSTGTSVASGSYAVNTTDSPAPPGPNWFYFGDIQ